MMASMTANIITADSLWNEFWRAEPINGTTINYIKTPFAGPFPFTVLLYAAIAAAILLLLILSRNITRQAVVQAIVCSFFAAGLIMALRMDYNWATAFMRDISILHGKDVGDRVVAVGGGGGGFYDFLVFVKRSLPEGAEIRDIEDHEIELKAVNNDENLREDEIRSFEWSKLQKYYLLPVLTTSEGRFVILVEGDMDGEYDAGSMTLRVNRSRFKARRHAVYGEGAAVYEIIEEIK